MTSSWEYFVKQFSVSNVHWDFCESQNSEGIDSSMECFPGDNAVSMFTWGDSPKLSQMPSFLREFVWRWLNIELSMDEAFDTYATDFCFIKWLPQNQLPKLQTQNVIYT